jgi:serine/threonine-protein kinase RsbW
MDSFAPEFSLQFPSSAKDVRGALLKMRSYLRHIGITGDAAGQIEIVLAEILNNVVEHALQEAGGGMIQLNCEPREDMLRFAVCDNGDAMPDGRVPGPRLPCLNTAIHDLPEGGFGWALVHMLARDLHYERIATNNILYFSVATSQPT